jgi:hypothetical protein
MRRNLLPRAIVPSGGKVLVALALLAGFTFTASAATTGPLRRAHAHNDYEHPHPLFDALSHGFWSVEADIWLRGTNLVVSHTAPILSGVGTLKELYLDPLQEFARTNQAAFKAAGPLTLLIDLKSDGKRTYAALDTMLRGYTNLFTRFEGGRVQTNSVLVLISGSRPVSLMRTQEVRFAALDGRLADVTNNVPVALTPWMSENWAGQFAWRGKGEMDAAERAKLRAYVKQMHAQGRRVRFWNVADTPEVWRELYDAGVDLLNTDKLEEMEEFLRAR